jgi:hypothetical protein
MSSKGIVPIRIPKFSELLYHTTSDSKNEPVRIPFFRKKGRSDNA